MKGAAIALLFLFCGIAYTQDALSKAVESISKAKVFAFGGVGYAGRTSQGESDFRVIQVQSPAVALQLFEKVFSGGSSEAKSYALAGIRQLDEKRFKELLQSLRDSKEMVQTMDGCNVETHSLVEVAREIDSGHYDPWINRRH
jgi:hypothetical protein